MNRETIVSRNPLSSRGDHNKELLKPLHQESENKETTVFRKPKKGEQIDNNGNNTVLPNNVGRKNPVRPQKSPRDYVGETRFPKRSGLATYRVHIGVWACTRQTKTSTGHCSIARQHQSEQVDVGRHFYHNEATPTRERRQRTFARVVQKKCSRHEERRLRVATRQTALSSRNETANEP